MTVRGTPPNVAVEVFTNPVPFNVISKVPGAIFAGLMDVNTGGGFKNVTVALAILVLSATLVAVTSSLFGDGIFKGAVKSPIVSIVPTSVFALICPATDQVTAVLVVPVTVAVNCCAAPVTSVALVGEMVTLILELGTLRTTM